jgi:hypothetical protein
MAENEELRLSITVDDQASAKIAELNQKVLDLSRSAAASSKGHLSVTQEIGDAFKRSAAALTRPAEASDPEFPTGWPTRFE